MPVDQSALFFFMRILGSKGTSIPINKIYGKVYFGYTDIRILSFYFTGVN